MRLDVPIFEEGHHYPGGYPHHLRRADADGADLRPTGMGRNRIDQCWGIRGGRHRQKVNIKIKQGGVMETVLKRSKFEVQAEDLLSNVDLLDQAYSALGYKPSAVTITRTRAERRKAELVVSGALESLGIDPIDKSLVAKYQKEKILQVQARGASKFVRWMHGTHGDNVVTMLGIVTFAGLAITAIVTASNIPDQGSIHLNHAQGIFWSFRLFLTCLASWVVLMVARHKRAEIYIGMWKAVYLQDYRECVPDFVIARALAIHEALPGTTFHVEHLTQETRNVETAQKPDPDPFLVMTYQHMNLYLDVWDEPGFEGRRMI